MTAAATWATALRNRTRLTDDVDHPLAFARAGVLLLEAIKGMQRAAGRAHAGLREAVGPVRHVIGRGPAGPTVRRGREPVVALPGRIVRDLCPVLHRPRPGANRARRGDVTAL